jgi:Flp pilus assembly protein TadG
VAVEFALVAPFFLFLLGGVIEFGQAFYIQSALSTAARHGARSAVLNGANNSQITQKAQSDCHKALGVSPSDITTAISINGHPNGDLDHAILGDEISVTVSIRYSKAAVGFFVDSFADSTLSSTCTLERK